MFDPWLIDRASFELQHRCREGIPFIELASIESVERYTVGEQTLLVPLCNLQETWLHLPHVKHCSPLKVYAVLTHLFYHGYRFQSNNLAREVLGRDF